MVTPGDCLAVLAEQRLLPADRRATYLSGVDGPADPVEATVVVGRPDPIAGLVGPDAGRAGRWTGPRRSCYHGDRRWDVDFWTDEEVDRLLRAVSWQALESGRSVGMTLRRYELEFVQRLGTARAAEGQDWVRRRQQDFAGSAVRTMVTTQLLMTVDRERERAGRLLAAGEAEAAVLAARAAVGSRGGRRAGGARHRGRRAGPPDRPVAGAGTAAGRPGSRPRAAVGGGLLEAGDHARPRPGGTGGLGVRRPAVLRPDHRRAAAVTADPLVVLLSVGSVSPRYSVDESVRAVEELGAERAADLLRRHKVRVLAAERLRQRPDSAAVRACLEQLQPDLDKLARSRDQLPVTLGVVRSAAEELGIAVVVFKGVKAREWYADVTWRDFGDLDLHVRSWSDARRLAERLRTRDGFVLDTRELPWLKRDAGSGALYGQILLTDPATGHLGVDIHFGAYSVRHCTHLPIGVPAEPGVHLATDADNVAAVVNNAAGDHFASMKDVNDLITAARRSPEGFRRGAALARQAELGAFLAILVRLVAATSAVGELKALFAPLLDGAPAEPVPPLPGPSWTRRWTAVALHAFRVGRRTSALDGVRLAAGAARYYRRRLSLAIVADTGPPEPLRLDEHTCVRLVPLDLLAARDDAGDLSGAPPGAAGPPRRLDDGLEVVSTPYGEVVLLGREVFVPTVFYRVPRDLVRSAVAVRDAGDADG